VTVTHAPNASPVANIPDTLDAQTEQILTFDASGSADSDGNIVSYLWEFGDGHQSGQAVVRHAYARP